MNINDQVREGERDGSDAEKKTQNVCCRVHVLRTGRQSVQEYKVFHIHNRVCGCGKSEMRIDYGMAGSK